MTYHMNKEEVTLSKLQGLLRTTKNGLKGKAVATSTPTTTPVLAIGQGKGKKRKSPSKGTKGKNLDGSSSSGTKKGPITPSSNPKEAQCFYCQDKGHFKRSYAKYLEDALRRSEQVEHGKINLVMGNRKASSVTKIGVYSLLLNNGLMLDLNKCCYSPEMARNIISFHGLYKQGFSFSFDNKNGAINVYYNDVFYFKAIPCDGVYEAVNVVDNLGNNVLYIDSSDRLDKASLWHCRLGHVNKKRIGQLQKAGVLESFDLKSNDSCNSCLLGKMTKSPFTGTCDRGEGLLDLVHTDVCGLFRVAIRDANRYYVTFTDDYSRYGYIYLIKHKSETFEKFKEFKQEVENQLGRNIKMLRSDRGGEYLSIEFLDYLKECGIVSQLTPPRKPQLNGVLVERCNFISIDSREAWAPTSDLLCEAGPARTRSSPNRSTDQLPDQTSTPEAGNVWVTHEMGHRAGGTRHQLPSQGKRQGADISEFPPGSPRGAPARDNRHKAKRMFEGGGGGNRKWTLYIDGASSKEGPGVGFILTSPTGEEVTYALRFHFRTSNNEAKYEALLAGLRLAVKMGEERVLALTDSHLSTK
uniref:Integrase catalytic domain-containing protein n=1 Tax=Lactuca sativa TaxID=4236 RepID=A0A9R1ULJ2_LACSA|nr:hypothetical protein LSAT_V11C800391190 [Lactuca sativa]